MANKVGGAVLLKIEDEHRSEVISRLREFTTNEGLVVEKAYPLQAPGDADAIAFVWASTRELFDWFVETISSYVGVKRCLGYPTTA